MKTYIIMKEQSTTKRLFHTLSKLYPYQAVYVPKSYNYSRYMKDAMLEIVSDAIQSGYETIKVLDGCSMQLHNEIEINELLRGVPYNYNIVVIEAKEYHNLRPYNDLCDTIRGADNIIGMFMKNTCFKQVFEALYDGDETFDNAIINIKQKYVLKKQSQLLNKHGKRED